MRTGSQVLCLNQPQIVVEGLGADRCESVAEAAQAWTEGKHPILVGHAADLLALRPLLPDSSLQWIVTRAPGDSVALGQLLLQNCVAAIAAEVSVPHLQDLIESARSRLRQSQQEHQLLQLFEEQNERLRKLSLELESRVERREHSLKKSHERLRIQNIRLEGLLRALMAMQKARSQGELESLLQEALSFILNIQTVSLARGETSPSSSTSYSAELLLNGRRLGWISFSRSEAEFSRDEKFFLDQVSETITLALDRLDKIALVEQLRAQWETTFDAITHPLCLLDRNSLVVRHNRNFADLPQALRAHDRLQSWLNEMQTTGASLLRKDFQYEDRTYDLSVQTLPSSAQTLLMFRDVTEDRSIEKRIFESARLAEMGTIGSSIAHELNNPLAGMISFLQLLRSDLRGDESFFPDILEMEKGAQRCKEIVQNLLGFSRTGDGDATGIFDLRQALEQAAKITTLQTRSKGIQFHLAAGPIPLWVAGQTKRVAQAFCHLIQNAAESIEEKYGKQKLSQGWIRVELAQTGSTARIVIQDNGARTHGVPAIGTTLAHQLLTEVGGRTETHASQQGVTKVEVHLPLAASNSLNAV